VPQPAWQDVLCDLLPLRHPDPLPAAAHVGQHLGDRTRGRRSLVEQLHRVAVGITHPQASFAGTRRGSDDGRARTRQRLAHRIQRARAQRERDVVQPLGRRLHHPDLLLVAAGTLSDQVAVLLSGLQAEVLQEPLRHLQVRHFQRVVVQS
jgi:hypothetical protein